MSEFHNHERVVRQGHVYRARNADRNVCLFFSQNNKIVYDYHTWQTHCAFRVLIAQPIIGKHGMYTFGDPTIKSNMALPSTELQ